MNDHTRLTVEAHGKKIIFEFDREDVTIDEWLDAWRTLMVGITFSPETVDQIITEFAEAIKENE